MTELRFVIDQNSIKTILTGDDIETIELFQEGEQVGSYRLKRMAAKFMVDNSGKPIPYKQALKIFGELKAEEYNEGLIQFIKTMVEVAIPKANGTPSSLPLEATFPKPVVSPDGS